MSKPVIKGQSQANVKRLYILTVLTNFWFMAGSWLYFYRLYASDRQIGILDGLTFAAGLIAEVPSGALADLLGRKKMLLIGLGLMTVGWFGQGFAHEYVHILIGMFFFTVGMSFISGADDALVFDSLKSENRESKWKFVVTRKYQIALTVTIPSYLAGGLLYVWYFRLPFLLAGVGTLLAIAVAFTFKEVKTKKIPFSLKQYVDQTSDGARFLLRKEMLIYAFMALVVLGAGYAFNVGVIKPFILDRFGYYATGQAIVNAVAGTISVLALTQLARLRRLFPERRGLIFLTILMALGFGISALPIGLWGIVAIIMIYVANDMMAPWLNDIVQHHAPSSHRATSLSMIALLQKLPYVILAPIAGFASQNMRLVNFLIGVTIAILLALLGLIVFGKIGSRRRAVSEEVEL